MKKHRLPFTILLFFTALFSLPAQGSPSPFLLPPTIFVGDPGRLVVPLDEAFSDVQPFVVQNPANLPERPELVIRRIELERRAGFSWLLIDFVPFAAGTVSFPSLDFTAPGEEPITLSGLEVQVSSVLDPAWMELSPPAPPLAVPGTGLLIYGSIAVILLVLFLGIAVTLWGKRNFRGFWQRLYRRHLLRAMMRFLRRLRHESNAGKNGNPGYHLSLLAAEFRAFLNTFTGINCRSLTSAEFLELPMTFQAEPPLTPEFLCRLFRAWDTLRFSGQDIAKSDLVHAVKETETFVSALYRLEREKVHSKPALKLAGETA